MIKMKNFKFLSLLFIVFAAMTLTSCLDDDDDNQGLSEQDIRTAFSATRGMHSGSLIYQPRGVKGEILSKPDTLTTSSWNITSDSTMTIFNVPDSALATAIADTTIMKAVRNLNGIHNINCYIGYIRVTPVQWLINPQTVTYNNLQYNGASHKVQLVFAVNSSISYGSLVTQKQELVISIAGMYIDDKLVNNTLVSPSGNGTSIKSFLFIEK